MMLPLYPQQLSSVSLLHNPFPLSLRPLLVLPLLIVLALLNGCAQRHTFTPPADLIAHQQHLQAIDRWALSGKLGIRTTDDSGSASVNWSQQVANYQINLSGPLGQKRMIITGTPKRVRLEQSGSEPLEARSAEALIRKAAGWTLPVTQLRYWVRGVPAPRQRITHLEQNSAGLIAQLTQGGWRIQYSNYKNYLHQQQPLSLPGKIIAEHEDVRLILVIRDWQLGQ